MKTVIYPRVLDYSFLRQRPQQIMSQFAKNGWRVIFCNNTQSDKPVEEVEPNLFVYHNFNKVKEDIKKGRLKIDLAYLTWAKSAEHLKDINAKFVLYDSLDSFDDWKPYELDAINQADIMLTTSQFLYERRSQQHKNVTLVRNACPSEFIDADYTIPEDMKQFNGTPVVGFVGAIGSWVSTNLMKKVAEKYTTVFVGLEFGKSCPSNVINLGVKNHAELVNYYNSLDVCILPFNTKKEVVQAANAVKQYEQMACGKITVATDWQETRLYKDAILASKDEEEFLSNVGRAIEMSKDINLKKKIKDIARQNTWENRFQQIEEAINTYVTKAGIKL